MQIQLTRNSHYYLDGACGICGDLFTPDAVIAVAYNQAGAEVGMLCEQCARADRQALRSRIQRQAAALRQHATTLDQLAAEDMAFPSHAEWEALEATHAVPHEEYLQGLWYESLNQMVAV
jgi:hypothetical protein